MLKPLHIINLVDMKTRIKMRNNFTTQLWALAVLLIGGWSTASAQCVITGDTSVCQGGIETYSIAAPVGGELYVWSVTNGGTIVGGNTGTSVDVEWGMTPGRDTVYCHRSDTGSNN